MYKELSKINFYNTQTNEHIGETRRFRNEPERESLKEVNKGVWGMPRLSEAKKDVISCEKLRGSANSS